MSAWRQLDLAQIDLRLSPLRVAAPRDVRRLQASIQSEGRIRDPVLVSTGVESRCWVLVDGFKRLRVAQELGFTQLWVQAVELDLARATAAILQCNQARQGLSELEEAWIVRCLYREQGLKQQDIAVLLKRDKSWVCRRLKIAEALDESLQNDVRLGLLSPTTARELAQLPRGNQQRAAQSVADHQLSSRQSALLVQRLRDTRDPQAIREVLADPLRYLVTEKAAQRAGDDDPRLGEDGNRLRRLLQSWQGFCSQLSRELRRRPLAADLPVLAPLLQDARRCADRLVQQLEAIHGTYAELIPPQRGEQASVPTSAATATHA
jgi:ParB-like chromosome segregation protein Spo0J